MHIIGPQLSLNLDLNQGQRRPGGIIERLLVGERDRRGRLLFLNRRNPLCRCAIVASVGTMPSIARRTAELAHGAILKGHFASAKNLQRLVSRMPPGNRDLYALAERIFFPAVSLERIGRVALDEPPFAASITAYDV